MTTTTKVKGCGHFECTLTSTAGCCGCEDKRGISKSYIRYVDGRGDCRDSSYNARYKSYCPVCKSQFQALRPGKKRCRCGVVSCDLTTDGCCICLDKRPQTTQFYKYQDGKGMTQNGATRWMHYCRSCQNRAKPPPLTMSPTKTIEVPHNKNMSIMPNTEERDIRGCKFSDSNGLASPKPTPTNNNLISTISPPGSSTESTRSAVAATSILASDVDDDVDYEIVNHCDVGFNEKVLAAGGAYGNSRMQKKMGFDLLGYIWKH